ncbi:uncharacterized protein LOC125476467 [Pyrus x bretschneideri]|uniref:uncharacterized protein LOC125476467 n=1 Tax=Pyrus x bretschneideri TaxID=225117 RepID=UPI0020305AE7|nr:uncharacterized protein LOC125476467 [Pyrus x bretschneideri]
MASNRPPKSKIIVIDGFGSSPDPLEDPRINKYGSLIKNRILVTVKNPNYGGFKYENSTAHISYCGNVVAEAPIRDDTVPARSTHNITSVVSILADKLVTDSHFLGDMAVGVLNLTSETTLHGKVNLLKVFKMKATSYSDCNISIYHYWNPKRRLRLQIEGKTR